MTTTRTLTARDTLGTWLKHPTGGPLVRELLTQYGVDEKLLTPFKLMRIERAVSMSKGAVTPEMVAELVRKANATSTA